MNPVLEDILRTGYTTSAEGELIKVHSHIPEEEGKSLQEMIFELRPKVSLEIGLGFGISSLYICEALAKVQAERHIIIDPFQRGACEGNPGWRGIGLLNLKRAGYEKIVEFHDAPSFQVLPKLQADGLQIDFAFIDGWHTFDYVLIDFFYVDKMLQVGGVVVLDDFYYPSIRKVCRYILTNLPYRVFTKLAPSATQKETLKRWLALNLPLVSNELRRITKPEILEPDHGLGLRHPKYAALKKEKENVCGDGSTGTRRWDDHHEF
jgi:predicted O-methyltransferase YrrM